MKSTKRIQLITQFSKEAKNYFAIVLLASFLSTALNSLVPKIFSFAIDKVLIPNGIVWFKTHLWVLAAFVIVIALFNGISIFLYRTYTAKAGESFAKNLRETLFAHAQRLPMNWLSAHQTGDIIQRCTSDVEVIRNFVINQVLEVFRTVFLIIISLIMMFSMNVKLTFIAIAFMPIIIAYSGVFYRLIARNFTKADEAEGELSTVVQENATGVRVVRAFGRETFEIDRFDEKNNIFAKMWIRLGTISGLYWGVGDLITGFQVMFIVIFGAIEAVHGNITAGEFVAFATYNTTLAWPVRALGRILSEMSKAGVSFDRVNYILDAEQEDMEQGNEIPSQMDISFDHVQLSYETYKPVLKNITLDIKEGETIGILGGTGSGKSTLIHLLTRLYETTEGEIRIGDIPIDKISKHWLREHVGMVLQEPFLFSRSILENIKAAKPDATLEEVRAAAKIACIDDSIMNFPDGYDTIVGERGVTLSGGQRQRVAIARMLLSKPPIMIFDDSFSAIDAQTDANIRHALRKEMEHATVIIISHRITTLMEADKIVVIHHGEIIESGTHNELSVGNGIYQKICEIQMNQDDRRLLVEDFVEGGATYGTC